MNRFLLPRVSLLKVRSPMNSYYADIIVDISHENLDKTYQYAVPERLMEVIEIGALVKIPFGKGNRLIKGYVLGSIPFIEGFGWNQKE